MKSCYCKVLARAKLDFPHLFGRLELLERLFVCLEDANLTTKNLKRGGLLMLVNASCVNPCVGHGISLTTMLVSI